MIKILIVDDNSNKIKQISKLIYEFSEIKEDDIDIAMDINDARRKLSNNKYELLILDINIPKRIGHDAIPNGGLELLEDICSIKRMNKPSNIVGITAHEKLKNEYNDRFNKELWMIIQYSMIDSEWQNRLRNKIKYIIEEKRDLMKYKKIDNEFEYDLAIITALREPELEAVLKLDGEWKQVEVVNDPTVYYEGIFKNDEKRLKVIAASSSQMGMPAAAVLSAKIINNFKPKYLVMVGIAAGIKEKANLGDILIAEQCWDYGNGKIQYNTELNKREFKPEPKAISIDMSIQEKFNSTLKKYTHRIYEEWVANKPQTVLRAIMGPVASGAAVVQDEKLIDEQVKIINRKLIGIEMEIYGVYCAATQVRDPKPKFFALKSVCDFADCSKSDDYQKYAAFTSATYLYYFALDQL